MNLLYFYNLGPDLRFSISQMPKGEQFLSLRAKASIRKETKTKMIKLGNHTHLVVFMDHILL